MGQRNARPAGIRYSILLIFGSPFNVNFLYYLLQCAGLKGTTKGSLFPTRNVALHNQFPLGIVSISAGENFTAVVTTNGKVFR